VGGLSGISIEKLVEGSKGPIDVVGTNEEII